MTNGKKLSEKSIGAVCAVVSIGAFIILWYWGTQATQLGLEEPESPEIDISKISLIRSDPEHRKKRQDHCN